MSEFASACVFDRECVRMYEFESASLFEFDSACVSKRLCVCVQV